MNKDKLLNFVSSTIIFFVVYELLVMSLQPIEIISGLVLAVILSFYSYKYLDIYRIIFNPLKWFWVIVYIFLFLKEMIKSNFDVARRVVSPRLPINPAFVKIKTTLKYDLAKLILANSITLTPGTLTIDVRGDELIIHWIDVSGQDIEEITKAIGWKFERILRKICR